METKLQILNDLTEIFTRWQELLASLSYEQINQPLLPSQWTVKDIVAHMWSWQQASVARMEAAFHGITPAYPKWWQILGPDPEEDVDRTNTWLYESNREKSWVKVYADWKTQFKHFLELSSQIPEKDLLEPGKYAWMGEYSLSASSLASLDHHREHYDAVKGWLEVQRG